MARDDFGDGIPESRNVQIASRIDEARFIDFIHLGTAISFVGIRTTPGSLVRLLVLRQIIYSRRHSNSLLNSPNCETLTQDTDLLLCITLSAFKHVVQAIPLAISY